MEGVWMEGRRSFEGVLWMGRWVEAWMDGGGWWCGMEGVWMEGWVDGGGVDGEGCGCMEGGVDGVMEDLQGGVDTGWGWMVLWMEVVWVDGVGCG